MEASEGVREEGEATELELGLGFPVWIASRRRFKSDDPFFSAGNLERELLAKQVALDLTEDERNQLHKMEIASQKFFCPIVGCGAKLDSLDDFESHYNSRHSASCSVCFRVYPTDRLLSIHISESHDSFFQAKVSRGFAMYECLVEGCEAKLKSYKSRHQHLIDKHQFPASFEFHKRAHFSKHQREKRRAKAYKDPLTKDPKGKMEIAHTKGHKDPKATQDPKGAIEDPKGATKDMKEGGMEIDHTEGYRDVEAAEDREEGGMEIDEIVLGVSKLSTNVDLESDLPKNVSFGRGNSRAFGFVPRSVKNKSQGSKK